MRATYFLAVFLAIFATAFAGVAQGVYNDPKHPGKCAIKPDLILSPGTHKDPNIKCGRIICGAGGHAEFQTCGLQIPPTGCSLGNYKHENADYPKCCDREFDCKKL